MRKHPKHPATYEVMQMWDIEDAYEFEQRIQELMDTHPRLKTWLQNKLKPWILAGLVREKSHILKFWWLFARSHTGLTESSHFTDNNFTGRQLSFLAAVLRYVDQRRMYCICIAYLANILGRLKQRIDDLFTKRKITERSGVPSTTANRSDQQRNLNRMRREGRLRY